MEAIQNNTFHTKMPGHVEGMKVAGALTLAAVAYFAKCHLLGIVFLTSARLSSSRFAQTPINALPEVSLEKVKVLQIATLVSLLACSFKGYHRAVAGIYTLSALKITSDYFFAQDQMIAQIFEEIGGEDKVSELPQIQFDPNLGVIENVNNNQNVLSLGWSVSYLSDGRRIFFLKDERTVDELQKAEVIAFVEQLSFLDLPRVISNMDPIVGSIFDAIVNKDTNTLGRELSYSQRNKNIKSLSVRGRFESAI